MFTAFSTKRKENWNTTGMLAPKLMKGKRTIHALANKDDIKIKRIKYVMEQKKKMADIREINEKQLFKMKEAL